MTPTEQKLKEILKTQSSNFLNLEEAMKVMKSAYNLALTDAVENATVNENSILKNKLQ